MDDGVRENSELAGAIDPRSKDFGKLTQNGVVTSRNVLGDERSNHGTGMAQIIAARVNGVGTQGYAPDADIVVLRVDDYNADTNTKTLSRSAEAVRYATEIELKIINRSMGSFSVNTAFQNAVAAYSETGGLLINSAGNSGGADPVEIINVTNANRSGWLFVAASGGNGQTYEIASYSNRCGALMDICVTAPGGQGFYNPINNRQMGTAGTSASAAVVSGLAATILEKWPQLSGQDAGRVIMFTARDIGDPGVDPVFGHGLVDFKAALSPVNPVLSNGAQQTSLYETVMVVGNAFDTGQDCSTCAGTIDGALSAVTVLDQFGRDFNGSLTSLVLRPDSSTGHWLRRRMEAQSGAGATGWIAPNTSGTLGYTTIPSGHRNANGSDVTRTILTNADFRVKLGEDTNLIAGFNTGDNVHRDIVGLAPTSDAMFAYSPLAQTSIGISRDLGTSNLAVIAYSGNQKDTRTAGAVVRWQNKAGTIKLGLLDETGSVFGTPVGAGALRFGDGATTLFAEVATGFEAGAWGFDGYASLGATRLKIGDDMLITDADMFTSARFGFNVSREALGGRASVGIAQELVALNAQATYTVGNGYDLASRSLTFGQREVDFSGRISPKLTAGYERQGEQSSLRLGASADTSGNDLRAVGTWSVRW